MATPPPLNPPRLGDPIGTHAAYVKRSSTERQANYWNMAIADDPAFGPNSSLAVAPMKDGGGSLSAGMGGRVAG
jgi:hypothetical protein